MDLIYAVMPRIVAPRLQKLMRDPGALVDFWAMKWARSLVAFVLLMSLFPSYAVAHPVPFSYVDIQYGQKSLEFFLTVHIFDVAHDLEVKPAERLLRPEEVATRADAIRALLSPRIHVRVDGKELALDWSAPEVVEDRQSLQLKATYSADALPTIVALNAIMFPYEPEHQTFVNVYENGLVTSQHILDSDHFQT